MESTDRSTHIITHAITGQLLMNTQVQTSLLREVVDSLGVVRIWQMSCTLPALSLESFGLLQLGLESTATRLRRMLALLLSGATMSEELSAVPADDGSLNLVMTVAEFVSAKDLLQEP